MASAYVSLVPSATGFRKAIDKELGGVGDQVSATGEDAGTRFGAGFGSKAALALGGVGLAIGGALVKGTMDAIDRQAANAQLVASLGLDDATAAKVGEVAGDVWANNFGENIGQVNEAIAAISTNLGDLSLMEGSDIQELAEQALTLSTILGEDVSRAARGVGQLIANGLVKDSTLGFDLIAAAAQRLPQEMRGELIDTVEEYSSSFEELGLTGEQAISAITRSVSAGARNTDLAADALKEFSIRSIDGSDLTIDAYKRLGFNAEQMMQTIANGGPAAAQATSDIIRAVAGVGDQVLQEQLGVALFGTQFEDLGVDAVAALDPLAGSLDNIEGATGRAADALGDTFSARLEALKRKGFDALIKVGERLLPFLEQVVAGVESFIDVVFRGEGTTGASGFVGLMEELGAIVLTDVVPAFRQMVDIGRQIVEFFANNQTALAAVAAVIGVVVVGAFIAWAVSAAAAAVATLAAIAPFILMAAAVAATAAAVIWAYQNWDWFRAAVDAVAGFLKDTLWPILKTVASFIIDELVPAVAEIVGWLANQLADNISNIAGLFSDLWNAGIEMKDQLVAAFNAVVDFVTELPGRLLDAGAGMWDFLTQPFEDAMNSIRSLWNDTVGGFSVTLPDWMPFGGGQGFTIPKLHSGGIVPGRTGSETLALLQAGELVISAADTRALMAVDAAPGGDGGRAPLVGTLVTDPGRPLLEQLVELQHLMPAA